MGSGLLICSRPAAKAAHRLRGRTVARARCRDADEARRHLGNPVRLLQELELPLNSAEIALRAMADFVDRNTQVGYPLRWPG